LRKVLLICIPIFIFFSCATLKQDTQDNLRERINAYYKAKIANDNKEAFKYENMGLDEKFTEGSYISNAAKSPVGLLEANILSINLNEARDVALVKMSLKYKLQPIKGFEKFTQVQEPTVEDKWKYTKGNWYHVIRGVTRDW
jgi:hypothetical protein